MSVGGVDKGEIERTALGDRIRNSRNILDDSDGVDAQAIAPVERRRKVT